MIAGLLLGLVAVGPVAADDRARQVVVLGWDAGTKTCSAKVRGIEIGDPTSEETRTALARMLPSHSRPIELHGGTDVPYHCVADLVAAMQGEGYRFQVGAAPEAPRLR